MKDALAAFLKQRLSAKWPETGDELPEHLRMNFSVVTTIRSAGGLHWPTASAFRRYRAGIQWRGQPSEKTGLT
jgi:hypothetical protein